MANIPLTNLPQIAQRMGVKETPDFHKAVKDDEADLAHKIRRVLFNKRLKEEALGLQGSRAQAFMQLLRSVVCEISTN